MKTNRSYAILAARCIFNCLIYGYYITYYNIFASVFMKFRSSFFLFFKFNCKDLQNNLIFPAKAAITQ